jgi:SPP1 gp7 family putative phage head morphogenesis protein
MNGLARHTPQTTPIRIHQHKPIMVVNQRDPTQTTVLRNTFVRDSNKRFNLLARTITEAIVQDDVFGLRDDGVRRINRNKLTVMQSPGPRAFDFPRSSDKIAAFMDWLHRQVENDILQVADITRVGDSVENAWTNVYIESSYRRGVTSARNQLVRGGFDVPPLSQTGGILASMSAPFHVDRLGLLFTRTFSELRGITAAMEQQIGRVLTQGIADGLGPSTLARQLVAVIKGGGADLGLTDTLGRFIPARRRAQILARTEIIRAHAEATLQEFESWGVQGVVVKAEWITAGDNRVCQRCADLEGSVFTIAQAQGMIPLHAQCRCAWLPFIDRPR